MEEKEINKLNKEQIDSELYRQIDLSWDREELIEQILLRMDIEEKKDWIKSWYEDGNGKWKWNWLMIMKQIWNLLKKKKGKKVM